MESEANPSLNAADSMLRPNRYNKSCECGRLRDDAGNRIVGGYVTKPHLFPWMVAILYDGKLHCGGTLINDRYILTAGHCVGWWIRPEDLTLILGMHDRVTLDEGTEFMPEIDQVIVHEEFSSGVYCDTQDIALIKLKFPVQFTPYISPVCLPKQGGTNYNNCRGIVSGWGHTSMTANLSRFLRKASVRILPQEECKNSSIGEHIIDNMMCAYADQRDACQGDSGGPLLYEKRALKIEQIGVVSWGIGCAKPGMPGVYTRMTEFMSWIQANTLDAMYCSR